MKQKINNCKTVGSDKTSLMRPKILGYNIFMEQKWEEEVRLTQREVQLHVIKGYTKDKHRLFKQKYYGVKQS